jgi:Icc-related predicted phosphoesterase
VKILVVSDKESSYIWDHFDKKRFEGIDLIISCGDLKAEYLSFLVTMINAPLFYVHGNHDRSYKTNPPEGCTCIDDKIVVFNGVRILGIGGSPLYNGKEFQYTEKQMEKRVQRLTPKIWWYGGFDILVTHTPAFGLGDAPDVVHTGFRVFRKLLDKYKPKYFLHGHQHLNYANGTRIINYNETTIINGYRYHIFDY